MEFDVESYANPGLKCSNIGGGKPQRQYASGETGQSMELSDPPFMRSMRSQETTDRLLGIR